MNEGEVTIERTSNGWITNNVFERYCFINEHSGGKDTLSDVFQDVVWELLPPHVQNDLLKRGLVAKVYIKFEPRENTNEKPDNQS